MKYIQALVTCALLSLTTGCGSYTPMDRDGGYESADDQEPGYNEGEGYERDEGDDRYSRDSGYDESEERDNRENGSRGDGYGRGDGYERDPRTEDSEREETYGRDDGYGRESNRRDYERENDRRPTEKPGRVSYNSAVQNLYLQAVGSMKAGDYDQAEATLERGLRIEPNNPYLWFELAQISAESGNKKKARELASRAQSLAGGDRYLLRQIDGFMGGL